MDNPGLSPAKVCFSALSQWRPTACRYSRFAGMASSLCSGLAVEEVRPGFAGIVCSEFFEVLFAARRGEGGIASSFRERSSLVSGPVSLNILLSFFPVRSL